MSFLIFQEIVHFELESSFYSNEDFSWKFGEGDLMKGNGFDFRVKNKDGNWTDIGNIMEIISNGDIEGYGLGLGVETLVAHKNGYKNPIEFFTEKLGLEIQNNEDIHLYDSLKILIDAYREGIKPGKKGANYEIKKTIKKINNILSKNPNLYLGLKNNISSLENVCHSNITVTDCIYNNILKKSGFEISEKPFSLLVDIGTNNKEVLNKLKEIFGEFIFIFKEEYTGGNIGNDKKSLTFSVKYISEKGSSKKIFNSIIDLIKKDYNIR